MTETLPLDGEQQRPGQPAGAEAAELERLSGDVEKQRPHAAELQQRLHRMEAEKTRSERYLSIQIKRVLDWVEAQRKRVAELETSRQALEDEHRRLSAELAALLEANRAAERELAGRSTELEAMARTHADLERRFSDARRQVSRLQQKLQQANRLRRAREAENRALLTELRHVSQRNAALLNSASWRMTAPVRTIRSWLVGGTARRRRPDRNIAAVLHLYYLDLWEPIASALESCGPGLKLFVTMAERDAPTERAVRRRFHGAEIIHCANRGRDIQPFLTLLNSGRLDRFDCVCKIHTKKSLHGDSGDMWREDVLSKLLGSPQRVDAIVSCFKATPELGLLGPEGYRNREVPDWGMNRDRVLPLAGAMGLHEELAEPDFFAGSMFWFRPAALKPLADLRLTEDAFEEEEMQFDGTLAHAVERLFSLAAKAAGFEVEDTRILVPHLARRTNRLEKRRQASQNSPAPAST